MKVSKYIAIGRKGFAPLIIALIVGVAALAIVGAFYYASRTPTPAALRPTPHINASTTLAFSPSAPYPRATINSGDTITVSWSGLTSVDKLTVECPPIGTSMRDMTSGKDFLCGNVNRKVGSSGSYALQITNAAWSPVTLLIVLSSPLAGGASKQDTEGDLTVNPAYQLTVSQNVPLPPPTDSVATILQSASTNTKGYTVSLYADGSAVAAIQGDATGIGFPPGAIINIATLNNLLASIGDVSKVKTVEPCIKSISFGTVTEIKYEGKTSGDLQCLGQTPPPAYASLESAVDGIEQLLSPFIKTGRAAL